MSHLFDEVLRRRKQERLGVLGSHGEDGVLLLSNKLGRLERRDLVLLEEGAHLHEGLRLQVGEVGLLPHFEELGLEVGEHGLHAHDLLRLVLHPRLLGVAIE